MERLGLGPFPRLVTALVLAAAGFGTTFNAIAGESPAPDSATTASESPAPGSAATGGDPSAPDTATSAGESSTPGAATPADDAPSAAAGFDPARHIGQVVYLDFWASWCAPCKQSFPWMNELQARYGDQGFEVIAVNLDKKAEAAHAFLKKAAPTFSIVFDPKGELATQYELQGMPTTVLFDRQGKVRQTHVGYRESDRTAIAGEIEALLAEPAPATQPLKQETQAQPQPEQETEPNDAR